MEHRQTYLNTYEECKYLFYKTAVLGDVPCSAEARDLGSVVHEAIRRILADGEPLVDAAIAFAIQKLKDTEGIPCISNESTRTAKWMIKNAIEKAQTFSPDFIEEYIEFKNIDENDLFSPCFHSQIDIFDKNTGTIYDWKTGRLKAKKRQLLIYAYMLKRKYGLIAKKGVFVYLRNGTVEEFDITPEDVLEAEKWVKDTIKEIESKLEGLFFEESWEDSFPPTPSTRCKTCPFSLECSKTLSTNAALQLESYIKASDEVADIEKPEEVNSKPATGSTTETYVKESLDVERLIKDMNNDPEMARLLGAEIIRQEGALKSMKNALKKFVENNGAVQIDAKAFDIYESVSWAFDADGKRDMAKVLLTEYGLNPWNYFEMSSTAKKNLQKDSKMAAAEIEEFMKKHGKQKKSKRFDCRTIGEQPDED